MCEDVRTAGAMVERVEPDPLASLTEMAERAGLTRAALTQYAKGQRASGFPSPVARVTTASPLWDWAIVSNWLCVHGKLSQDEVVLAKVVKAANESLANGASADLRERLKQDGRACISDSPERIGGAEAPASKCAVTSP